MTPLQTPVPTKVSHRRPVSHSSSTFHFPVLHVHLWFDTSRICGKIPKMYKSKLVTSQNLSLSLNPCVSLKVILFFLRRPPLHSHLLSLRPPHVSKRKPPTILSTTGCRPVTVTSWYSQTFTERFCKSSILTFRTFTSIPTPGRPTVLPRSGTY